MSAGLTDKTYNMVETGLSSNARQLLSYLAWKATDAGVAWPLVQTMMKATGLPQTSLYRALKELLLSEFVTKKRKKNEGVFFTLNLAKIDQYQDKNSHSGNSHSGNSHSGNSHSGNSHSGNSHSGKEFSQYENFPGSIYIDKQDKQTPPPSPPPGGECDPSEGENNDDQELDQDQGQGQGHDQESDQESEPNLPPWEVPTPTENQRDTQEGRQQSPGDAEASLPMEESSEAPSAQPGANESHFSGTSGSPENSDEVRVQGSLIPGAPSAREADAPPPTAKKRKPKPDYTDEFEVFWAVYPRHVGKAEAAKAYQKAREHGNMPSIEELKKCLYWANVNAWRDTKERYIPHASTWLNQGRWNDDMCKDPFTPEPEPDYGVWADQMQALKEMWGDAENAPNEIFKSRLMARAEKYADELRRQGCPFVG